MRISFGSRIVHISVSSMNINIISQSVFILLSILNFDIDIATAASLLYLLMLGSSYLSKVNGYIPWAGR